MRTLSQLENDLYVRIDKDWFNDDVSYIKKYGHTALLIYSYLQRGITNRNELYFSIDNIAEYLNINSKNYKSRQNIISNINKFDGGKLLELYKVIDKHDTLITAGKLKQFDGFIMLYDFEIDAIVYSGKNIDIGKLLAVFLYIKSCVNYNDKYCYPKIETIAKMTDINSEKSIIKYIKLLKELGLILYKNVGLIKYDKENIRYEKNVYVMNYEGHDTILDDYIQKKEEEFQESEVKIVRSKNANNKRSESMKLYWEKRKLGIN
jgi:hypothetical protein